MNPLLTLLLDPTAGSAGFNLVAVMFYFAILVMVFIAMIERSFHE